MSFKLAPLGCFLSSLQLLAVFISATAAAEAEDCSKVECKGPIRFYEELQCKPIYEKSGDCCAAAYNCSHLDGRLLDKCYANGHEYGIGEKLKDEDIVNPCDKIGCFCSEGPNGLAKFSCPIVDCAPKQAKPGCYLKIKPDSCCGREEICPENPEATTKCIVDGKTYSEGERFVPNSEPTLACQCLEGYEGKNVPPFCRKTSCRVELKRPFEIRKNCAPVYGINESTIKNCGYFYRCQEAMDVVECPHGEDFNESGLLEHEWCKFGNLTLHVGDKLSHASDSPNECVECKCEVPPTLTCKRLPQEEC